MRSLIFSGGSITNPANINILPEDYIIAADSGYNYLHSILVKPDVFIGDMDSVLVNVNADEIIKLNVMKDETDTEAAVNLALSKGYDEIIIYGGTGTRADHSLANMFLLKMIHDSGAVGCLIDEHNEIRYFEKEIVINGNSGELISIIPFSDLINTTTKGLLYSLKGETLYIGKSRGVSNVMTGSSCRIKADSGYAFIFKSRD